MWDRCGLGCATRDSAMGEAHSGETFGMCPADGEINRWPLQRGGLGEAHKNFQRVSIVCSCWAPSGDAGWLAVSPHVLLGFSTPVGVSMYQAAPRLVYSPCFVGFPIACFIDFASWVVWERPVMYVCCLVYLGSAAASRYDSPQTRTRHASHALGSRWPSRSSCPWFPPLRKHWQAWSSTLFCVCVCAPVCACVARVYVGAVVSDQQVLALLRPA